MPGCFAGHETCFSKEHYTEESMSSTSRFQLFLALSLSLAVPTLAYAEKGDPTDGEIRIEAENHFYGLSWEISVVKDLHGLQRTTTVRDLRTGVSVTETRTVSPRDAAALWKAVEGRGCWTGPHGKDWVTLEADSGTVLLKHRGHEKYFKYTEYWNVVAAVETFANLNAVRSAARQKGLGNDV
jgi:hypothetical protein